MPISFPASVESIATDLEAEARDAANAMPRFPEGTDQAVIDQHAERIASHTEGLRAAAKILRGEN